ncbi:BREX-2 system adenine-specific DNA-methyltransferase PglX [Spirillospora sp. NPDC048819]|uniref:BREX-2 system adenine-specific DNA-methyltransferase PglX n=1 Tax=Spirillospora sp. NPDC048819 TaxID=3155268 RepID=UPI0033FDE4B4
MIDRKALLADLKKQVGTLEGDLRERAADDAETHARLYGEWQKARTANRIAATYESWLDDRVTQAAVAWVLGTVFLRFCEDNGLIEMPFLAGPGDKLDLAQERQADYIRQNPHDTDRDWILAGFKAMSRSPVAAGLFDRAHNPMWQIEIPHHAAKALLAFWRQRDEDGETVHDFTDPEWDTRFLGDLYQDLSEDAKKTYALLQTPEFVEEFILDYTLEPAVDEFGLDGLRLIDPTCGSGHFLLGAFHRILNRWRNAESGTGIWELIRRTLLSVHGVDKNPFATNIARFRLLAATMKAGGVSTLAQAPDFPIVVATGDSLLHGRGAPGVQEDLLSEAEPHTYATEDIYAFISSEGGADGLSGIDLLGAGSYHVVVGNPPYIAVSDRQENENYRNAYRSCVGTYALSVPFVERFFQLARLGSRGNARSGLIGQITANSFMKRQFGKRLVSEYLPTVDITHVIDTSGAYIPGHGTPTVILFARRQWPMQDVPVPVVMGVRGEPAQPAYPARGLVWTAILSKLSGADSGGEEWVSLESVSRATLAQHPWRLGGGGKAQLLSQIESASTQRLKSLIDGKIGFASFPGQDEVFILGDAWMRRNGIEFPMARHLVVGEVVRDWGLHIQEAAFVPYGEDQAAIEYFPNSPWGKHLWCYRSSLKSTTGFGGVTKGQADESWWTWYRWVEKRYLTPYSITFAFVATHNHFSLDRGDKVYKQTAPVIKLHKDASESEHLRLLGVLNSSTACFWLKQVSQQKGGAANSGGGSSDHPWSYSYEFTSTNVQEYPLPPQMPSRRARRIDRLALALEYEAPKSVVAGGVLDREILDAARDRWRSIRGQIIAEQEELDWEVYCLYGLLGENLTAPIDAVPEIRLGERAFEIVLARNMRDGDAEAEWFRRHGSVPITDIPEHWPDEYRRVVEKRIEVIESRRDIALIERPECKRRWITVPLGEQERVALRAWLLDRCEARALWFANDEYGLEQPRTMTVNQLADRLGQDKDFVSIARLYAGEDADLTVIVDEVTREEHVPHLAALRYNESALRKRGQWETVWEQQREEDRSNKRLEIAIPAPYKSADFLESYWKSRGKLDVPKERFISYPGSGPDGDSSMLLGWAGWDHREQAQALMMLIEERATQDGWDAARLTPLLAGLAEVLPWVRQWHGEIDPAFGQSPADAYTTYLESKQREYGISDDDLKNWRPEKPKRGGRRKKDP